MILMLGLAVSIGSFVIHSCDGSGADTPTTSTTAP